MKKDLYSPVSYNLAKVLHSNGFKGKSRYHYTSKLNPIKSDPLLDNYGKLLKKDLVLSVRRINSSEISVYLVPSYVELMNWLITKHKYMPVILLSDYYNVNDYLKVFENKVIESFNNGVLASSKGF